MIVRFFFKSYFLFFSLFFVGQIANSQLRKYIVIDKESYSGIEGVNIDFLNGKGTQSDKNGFFEIDTKINNFRISFVGYESLELQARNIKDSIFLKHSVERLEMINVKNEKVNAKRIFPSKNISNILPKNYGTGAPIQSILMKAVFIPNLDKDSTKMISKIILFPTDYSTIHLTGKVKSEKQKNQKYAPFKINLYTVATVIGIPLKKIFATDIMVELKQGENQLTYELTLDQQLYFPAEGIFIAFSSFTKEYYKELGFKSGPAFKIIGISEKSKFQVYEKSFAFCETDEDCKWFRDQFM